MAKTSLTLWFVVLPLSCVCAFLLGGRGADRRTIESEVLGRSLERAPADLGTDPSLLEEENRRLRQAVEELKILLGNRSDRAPVISDADHTERVVVRYEDGSPQEEGFQVGGQRHGPWTEWHENGQERAEGMYYEGKKWGPWSYWNDKGLLELHGSYVDGERDGDWFKYRVDKPAGGAITIWRYVRGQFMDARLFE
jgi:hypothetical protein